MSEGRPRSKYAVPQQLYILYILGNITSLDVRMILESYWLCFIHYPGRQGREGWLKDPGKSELNDVGHLLAVVIRLIGDGSRLLVESSSH